MCGVDVVGQARESGHEVPQRPKSPSSQKSTKSTKGQSRDRSLSREAIIEAAQRLIARHGAESLSMRMLADELGVSPMAAYYYVSSKDDLLRLVGNALLQSVAVLPAGEQPWDTRLRYLISRQREVLKQYPGLREALRGVDLDERRRLEDAEFEIFLQAGFPPATAVPAFRTLLDWSLGNSLVESSLRDREHRRPPEEWTKAQRATFDRKLMPPMTADAYFDFGLDIVIEGLRRELAAAKKPADKRRTGA